MRLSAKKFTAKTLAETVCPSFIDTGPIKLVLVVEFFF